MRQDVDALRAKLARVNFQYSNPTPGFDRRRVKGLVAELVKLKDPRVRTCMEHCSSSISADLHGVGGLRWRTVVQRGCRHTTDWKATSAKGQTQAESHHNPFKQDRSTHSVFRGWLRMIHRS